MMPQPECSPPLLSQSARRLTFSAEALDERGERVTTAVPGENPLTVYIDRREIVTLMTLGSAPEALVIGYLRNQRLVRSLDEIAAVQVDWEVDAAAVSTRPGHYRPEETEARLQKRTVTTGCGQGTVFGELMAEIDAIHLPEEARLGAGSLAALMEGLRQTESVYKLAGAVHGCALVRNASPQPEILMFVEDVGRHNAVDTIAGKMWLEGLTGEDMIFYTTGRLTSEMVIKTAQMGIPFLVSRSGTTEMGWKLASRIGITMIGRARGNRHLLYSGAGRFIR